MATWRGRRGLRAAPGADGRARNGFCPGASRKGTAPSTPRPRTSDLESAREYISVVSSYPFCGDLLWQPREAHTAGDFTRLVLFSLIRSPLCQPCDLARTVPSIRSVLFSALRFYESTKSNFFSKPKAGTRRCRAGSHLWVCRQTLGRNGPGSHAYIGMQKFSIISLPPESRLVGHAGRARYQKEVLLSAGRA